MFYAEIVTTASSISAVNEAERSAVDEDGSAIPAEPVSVGSVQVSTCSRLDYRVALSAYSILLSYYLIVMLTFIVNCCSGVVFDELSSIFSFDLMLSTMLRKKKLVRSFTDGLFPLHITKVALIQVATNKKLVNIDTAINQLMFEIYFLLSYAYT